MSNLVVIETVDQALVMVDRAHLALSAAVDFQSTRQVRNLMVAAAAYAREANDTRLLSSATELRTRAERKAGQMLDASAKSGERALRGDTKQPERMSNCKTFAPNLTDIGITRDQSSKWQAVGKLTDTEFAEALETTKAITYAISTPKVLRVARSVRKQEPQLVNDDEVAPAPPTPTPTHNEQAVAFYNAVRALGELTCSAADLRTALPSYQHFRILENVGPAISLLQKVKSSWTT